MSFRDDRHPVSYVLWQAMARTVSFYLRPEFQQANFIRDHAARLDVAGAIVPLRYLAPKDELETPDGLKLVAALRGAEVPYVFDPATSPLTRRSVVTIDSAPAKRYRNGASARALPELPLRPAMLRDTGGRHPLNRTSSIRPFVHSAPPCN